LPERRCRTSLSWTTATSYYLASSNRLTTTKPSSDSTASYVYDPRDPVKTVGGNNLMLELGPMDQRAIGPARTC